MKNKKLLIGLMLITSSVMIGCSNKISNEEKVIDSVVIDEDAKETDNKINISKVATTENLNGTLNEEILIDEESLIKIQYSDGIGYEEGEIYQSQFPKIYIDSLPIGTITEEVKNKRNIINWRNKEINGQLIVDYMGSGDNFRIKKNDKVYILDKNYNLKEITAYKKLIEETNGNLNRFQSSEDGNLDIYFFDEGNGIEKMAIIDIINNKYYELTGEAIDIIKDKFRNVLAIDNEKIYILLEEGTSTTIGYIEDNKFNIVLDKKSGIDIWVQGGIIFSNNKILISGFLDENYGVWRYDVDKKEITKAMEVKYLYSLFKINKEKNMIIIENLGIGDEKNISIARINENLEISDIQDITKAILSDENYNDGKSIKGWSNNGDKFYVKTKKVDNGEKLDDVYYEVYEAK
ncbi:hypothetical protein [uncultured Clostridium sp.]|uniref:hypothetical protein n=1 Tax=uncultured Clostridium sp. TaxID=59620 RepID=UPI0025E25956|nr:hypothetical protein [uncultured Clostridium sp.]